MRRLRVILVLIPLTAAACREIWHYQPMGARREVRDGRGFWFDLGEVHLGSWCPFVVAPWERGEECVFWSFKLQNQTEADLRVDNVHLRVGKIRIRPNRPVDDDVNGLRVPARGESEFSVWFNFPDSVADIQREIVLTFDLATPEGPRTKEVPYSY